MVSREDSGEAGVPSTTGTPTGRRRGHSRPMGSEPMYPHRQVPARTTRGLRPRPAPMDPGRDCFSRPHCRRHSPLPHRRTPRSSPPRSLRRNRPTRSPRFNRSPMDHCSCGNIQVVEIHGEVLSEKTRLATAAASAAAPAAGARSSRPIWATTPPSSTGSTPPMPEVAQRGWDVLRRDCGTES